MARVIDMKSHAQLEQPLEIMTVTVDMATKLLECNKCNRPVSQQHVNRIAKAITEGHWRFNGDTIKVSDSREILDGQHRLWAVIESGKPIETIVVHGIKPDAFATIDTMRKPRSGADILSLKGLNRHRKTVSQALMWLKRYQTKTIPRFRAPENRVENSDVEELYEAHPLMVEAADQVRHCRRVMNLNIAAFLYYVFANKDAALAESFVQNIENPAGISAEHPFFLYREWLLKQKLERAHRDPIIVIAMGIKAWNAARKKRRLKVLNWKSTGKKAEAFPTIE